jgi:DNA-binding NtrC family response regulator
MRILVVDDVSTVREVLRAVLELEGARVRTAATAREAIELSRTEVFDVVLTDLRLPDVSGEVIINHFRTMSKRRTPVAVLSGAGERDLARAENFGADRIFNKPIEWDDLVGYLEGRQAVVTNGADLPTSEPEKRMTVVIVEDDAAMRALLEDVLERVGHRVIALPDGTGLAHVAEHEQFDAVILDKEMPGPNGLDLLAYLRHRRPDVPVIFVTAFGGPDVAEEATRRGAWSYIEKPFRIGTILDAVDAVPQYRFGTEPSPRDWRPRERT